MTEAEAILARHSVRHYQDKKIAPEAAAILHEAIAKCNTEGRIHMQLHEDAGRLLSNLFARTSGLSSAPAAITCSGVKDDTLEERIGYWGERIVLLAQTLGLNTCWVGMCDRKAAQECAAPGESHVIVIAIGYGVDQGKERRTRPMEALCSVNGPMPDWFRSGMEAAMLAPTAINQQKFLFTLHEDGSVTADSQNGPFHRLDLGIVRYHFDVGAAACGQERNASMWGL